MNYSFADELQFYQRKCSKFAKIQKNNNFRFEKISKNLKFKTQKLI